MGCRVAGRLWKLSCVLVLCLSDRKMSFCKRNEDETKKLVNKLAFFTQGHYKSRFVWRIRKIRSFRFKLKDKTSHPSSAVYYGTCTSCKSAQVANLPGIFRLDKRNTREKESFQSLPATLHPILVTLSSGRVTFRTQSVLRLGLLLHLRPLLRSGPNHYLFMIINPIRPGGEGKGGGGWKVPAPISTFENFLDI